MDKKVRPTVLMVAEASVAQYHTPGGLTTEVLGAGSWRPGGSKVGSF